MRLRRREHPCLAAQVIAGLAAAEAAKPASGDADARSDHAGTQPDSRVSLDGVAVHGFAFLVGSWTLALANLSLTPDCLWFWPWVVAWAAVVAVHCTVALLETRRTSRSRPSA